MTDKFEHLLMCKIAGSDVINSQHEVADLDPSTLCRAAPSHLPSILIIIDNHYDTVQVFNVRSRADE